MIISLSGTITHKGKGYAVIETAGLGYQVFMNPRTLAQMEKGQAVRVWTHEHIREDMRDLYGVGSAEEYRMLVTLIDVDGVGPRKALDILSLGDVNAIESMIERGDVERLCGIPGVGRKTAQKIILELKGKLVDATGADDGDEVLAALTGLGYAREKAREALGAERVRAAGSAEEKLRLALRELGR